MILKSGQIFTGKSVAQQLKSWESGREPNKNTIVSAGRSGIVSHNESSTHSNRDDVYVQELYGKHAI